MTPTLAYLRSAVANWRTSLPALLTVAVVLAHAFGAPANVIRGCEVVVSLATLLGLFSAADAQRLARVEAIVEKVMPAAKADPEAPGALDAEAEAELGGKGAT